MEIFKLNEQYEVEIDKAWLMLIPEFHTLMKRDKGSPGDNEGRKKLRAKKQFAYIYFRADFKSPIWEWDQQEQHEEALRYTSLKNEDIDEPVLVALEEYKKIQYKGSRALQSIEGIYMGLDAIDNYYKTLDFKKTDKMGKLLHNPREAIMNIKLLKEGYENLSKFKQSVEEELKKNNTIRGTSTLGDKEMERRTTWKEGGGPTKSPKETPNWGSLANIVQRDEVALSHLATDMEFDDLSAEEDEE